MKLRRAVKNPADERPPADEGPALAEDARAVPPAEDPEVRDVPPDESVPPTATIASRPGLVRAANEDCAGAFGWVAPRDTGRPVTLSPGGDGPLVAVVADGVGGHRGGATASSIAVDRLLSAERALSSPKAIVSVLRAVHAELLALGADNLELRHLATTVVVLVVLPDHVLCAHVGDSRIYYVEDGLVQQLTADDAVPDSGALTQVLGGLPGTRVDPHVRELPRDLPARYLMCSDGLHGYVAREAIRDATTIADPLAAVTALVETTYAAGAPDNVSVCLLDVPGVEGNSDGHTN